MLDALLLQFLDHLRYERNVSVHTLRNYASDLDQFLDYLAPADAIAVPVFLAKDREHGSGLSGAEVSGQRAAIAAHSMKVHDFRKPRSH